MMDSTIPRLVSPATPSRKTGRINLTVAGVLAVFAYLYYVDVFCVIVPWLSYSVPGVTNIFVLTIITGLSLYCYLFCVLLDPGRVPDDWQPDQEAASSVQEVKKKGGAPRFCQKCQKPKPPRTHHCRVCQRCVLRMDHHCPWTNNCIGHGNYRAFLLFLIYVNAALVHTLGLLASHTIHTIQTSQQQRVIRTGPQSKAVHLQSGIGGIWLWAAQQTLAFMIALPLTVGLMMLLGWHIHLTLNNKTTIEHQEGVTARLQLTHGEVYQHPYDLGTCNNLHEVLGDGLAEWVLPPCSLTAGGTKFATVWDEQWLGLRGR